MRCTWPSALEGGCCVPARLRTRSGHPVQLARQPCVLVLSCQLGCTMHGCRKAAARPCHSGCNRRLASSMHLPQRVRSLATCTRSPGPSAECLASGLTAHAVHHWQCSVPTNLAHKQDAGLDRPRSLVVSAEERSVHRGLGCTLLPAGHDSPIPLVADEHQVARLQPAGLHHALVPASCDLHKLPQAPGAVHHASGGRAVGRQEFVGVLEMLTRAVRCWPTTGESLMPKAHARLHQGLGCAGATTLKADHWPLMHVS